MKLSIAELAEDCCPEEIMIGTEDKALTRRVKARVLAQIRAERGQERRTGHPRSRRLLTLALAAALLLSFGLVAYAISSVHARKQEELRQELNMDGSHAKSYVEYEVPAEDAPGLVLLSAINDGEFQKLYVNVSPVTEEQLDRYEDGQYFMWQLEGMTGFGSAEINLKPDRSVHNREELMAAIREDAYDAETQTLTLRIYISENSVREAQQSTGSDAVTLHVWLWDGMAWEESGSGAEFHSLEDWLRALPGFGSVRFLPTEREAVFFDLGGYRWWDEESGRELELLSLELGPSSAVWRFRFAEAERVYADPDQRELMAWLGAGDRALTRLRLLFADGTELALPGPMRSPLENGAVCAYLGWEKAVDIHAVTRITLGDTVLWTRGE